MSVRQTFVKYGKIATLRHLYEPFNDKVSEATQNFEFSWSEKTMTKTN